MHPFATGAAEGVSPTGCEMSRDSPPLATVCTHKLSRESKSTDYICGFTENDCGADGLAAETIAWVSWRQVKHLRGRR